MKRLILASNACLTLAKAGMALGIDFTEQKAAFVTTAADPYPEKPWMFEDREALGAAGSRVTDLDIKNKTYGQLQAELKDTQLVFVAGGNVFYLLYHARRSGFDRLLAEKLAKGVAYAGSSAGAALLGPDIAVFRHMDDPSQAPPLSSTAGLMQTGFIPLVHWGNPKYKEKYMRMTRELYEGKYPFVPLRDNEAVVVGDDKLEIVSA